MHPFRQLLSQNASTFVSMGLLMVVPFLGSSALLAFFFYYNQVLQSLNFGGALLYFLVITLTMTLALTPTTFMAIITGYYFGWAGFPGMVAAYAGALLLARLITNQLDHGKLWRFLHRFPKVARCSMSSTGSPSALFS